MKIGGWGGEISIKLKEGEKRRILELLKEGAEAFLAYAWAGGSREMAFNVAIVFAKDVKQIETKRILVAVPVEDGVAWGVVDSRGLIKRGVLRPDLARISRLRERASKLEELCARGTKQCREALSAKKRIQRILREFVNEKAAKIAKLAVQYKATLVLNVPESYWGVVDVELFRKSLRRRAEWHGLPYREVRVQPDICPRCGSKMELHGKRLRCPNCGFEAPREEAAVMAVARQLS